MKAIKTITIVSLIVILSAVNANAWSKKDQGILIGASAALLIPPLLQLGKSTHGGYYEQKQVRHMQQPFRYVEPPRTTYIIQPQDYGFMHRKPKNHSFINKKDYGSETIIIERGDGSTIIIER
ncbi:MAG: hypothetical protein LBS39_03220 [Campylobacteraceae bacterium]|jgi:hypothetical protein|nr:hypothetical protein [Campylobacteraceae bacterium]